MQHHRTCRRQIAITIASVATCAVISALIDQPGYTSGEQIDEGGPIELTFRRPHIAACEAPIPNKPRSLKLKLPGEPYSCHD